MFSGPKFIISSIKSNWPSEYYPHECRFHHHKSKAHKTLTRVFSPSSPRESLDNPSLHLRAGYYLPCQIWRNKLSNCDQAGWFIHHLIINQAFFFLHRRFWWWNPILKLQVCLHLSCNQYNKVGGQMWDLWLYRGISQRSSENVRLLLQY